MKLIRTVLLSAAAFVSMAACNKEESGETDPGSISGTYHGYSSASCAMFQNMIATDQSLTVTEGSEGTVSVSFISDSWGEFSFPSCTAGQENSVYRVSGSGSTEMGMGGNISEYEASLEAWISEGRDSFEFTFSIPAVMGGLTIRFLSGEAPETDAGNE